MIKCHVSTCRHNDVADNVCRLENITVGNTSQIAHSQHETECESFAE